MTEDPYEILGVSRDASADDIKKAYRKKVRENHPDLNPDDPQAEERVKKINEAYDRITNPEKYAKEDARNRYHAPYNPSYTGYSSSGGSQDNPFAGGGGSYRWVEVDWDDIFGGWAQSTGVPRPEVSANDSPEMRQAVQLICSSSYKAALSVLASVPLGNRTARWYYLASLANYGAGNTVAAVDQIKTARKKDPANAEYRQAEATMSQRAQAYQQESEARGFSTMCSNWTTLCCMCLGMQFCFSAFASLGMGGGYIVH